MRLGFTAVIAAALMAAGTAAFAQGASVTAGEKTPRQHRAQRANRAPASGAIDAFAKQLGLTEDQKAKVQTAVTNYREGVRGVMMNASLKPEEKKAKVEELRNKADLEVRATLTAQQSEQAQKEGLIQKLLAPGAARLGMKELAEYLKLTPDQQQKLRVITQEQRTKQREIMQNTNLDQAAKRDQLKTLRTETNKKIEAILTDEQKAKYQELMKTRPGAKARAEGAAKGRRGHGKKNAGESAAPAANP